jgi:Lon protease-like protein
LSQVYAYELSQDDPLRPCPVQFTEDSAEEVLKKNADGLEEALLAIFGIAPSLDAPTKE